ARGTGLPRPPRGPRPPRRRRLAPARSRGLADLGRLADLEAVTIAVGARRQCRPLAVATEVPRLEALAVIRPGGGHDLRREARDEHVAAPTGWRALHRDVAQVLIIHGSRLPFRRRSGSQPVTDRAT